MTSGPPPAFSWATPPEFYTDENTVTRAVLRRLRDLGYIVHTPAQLFGSREAARGISDEEWLTKVGGRGWAIIGRDAKIYERPSELAAYKSARIQVFLLPGEATSAELVSFIERNLRDICAVTTLRQAGTWRLTWRGPEPYDVAEAKRTGQCRTGQGHTGQGRTGQGRVGQGRTGQRRTRRS